MSYLYYHKQYLLDQSIQKVSNLILKTNFKRTLGQRQFSAAAKCTVVLQEYVHRRNAHATVWAAGALDALVTHYLNGCGGIVCLAKLAASTSPLQISDQYTSWYRT